MSFCYMAQEALFHSLHSTFGAISCIRQPWYCRYCCSWGVIMGSFFALNSYKICSVHLLITNALWAKYHTFAMRMWLWFDCTCGVMWCAGVYLYIHYKVSHGLFSLSSSLSLFAWSFFSVLRPCIFFHLRLSAALMFAMHLCMQCIVQYEKLPVI